MPFGKKADEDDDFVEPVSKKKIKTYDEQRREGKLHHDEEHVCKLRNITYRTWQV